MRSSLRAAFALFALLLGRMPIPTVQASQPLQAGTGWSDLAPGVQYQEFVLPGPVRGAGVRGGGPGAAAVARAAEAGRPVSTLMRGMSCSRTLSIDWPTLPTLAGLVT